MKRFFLPFSMMFSLMTAFSGGCGSSGEPAIPPMSADAVLIDVRSEAEYRTGHVKGAVLIPHDRIAEKIAAAAPEKQRPVYLYCRTGRRAGIAAETLKSLHYAVIYNLGSLEDALRFLGRPLEK